MVFKSQATERWSRATIFDYSFDGSRIEVTSIRHGRMSMPTPDIDVDDDLDEGLGDISENASSKP